MREFTLTSVITGVAIGVLFGMANAFIGLRVGMTISASIPAAVISMAVLRGMMKRKSILENNMVQTIGSAGESLAAGMIFTIPALLIFGYNVSFLEIVLWGAIGGLLGVLFMVPLRKMLIVREHGKLPFPEGVACAEVLESGDRGGAGARTVFWGAGVGAIFEFFRSLGFWPETARQRLPLLKTDAALNAEPALLGVGYILGARVSAFILSGAVLGWFVIIPAIYLFGAGVNSPIYPETVHPIASMSPEDLWTRYLRFIGAGAVVLGGLISLIKGIRVAVHSLFSYTGADGVKIDRKDRTQRDLPLIALLVLLAGLGVAMWYLPQIRVGHFGAIAVLIFAFFFVTVSSRLVGIVGASSNPASGMTIATLLGTALVAVYGFNMTGDDAKFIIISVGALVCIAICIAGDCSQDLKTGYLVKATPWKQQIGELIGVLASTAAIAGLIIWLSNKYGFDRDADPRALLAPQANIMKLLVEGVVDGSLPWPLILSGAAAALVVEMLGIGSLPFAVGLYLPLGLSTPIMAGGLLRWIVDKRRKPASESQNRGVLAASGLVAGQGLMGLAVLAVVTSIVEFSSPGSTNAAPAARPTTRPAILAEATPTTTTQPAGGEATPVEVQTPADVFPWLAYKFNWLEPDYGLKPVDIPETSNFAAFRGDYAIQPFLLLPLAPFALLVAWLLVISLRPLPEDDVGWAEPPKIPASRLKPEPPTTESETDAPDEPEEKRPSHFFGDSDDVDIDPPEPPEPPDWPEDEQDELDSDQPNR
jgi:putative OPT family oligopeptide transporter